MEYIKQPTGKVTYTLDGVINSPEFDMDISGYSEMCKFMSAKSKNETHADRLLRKLNKQEIQQWNTK